MSLKQLVFKTLNSERKVIYVYSLNTVLLILIFTMIMDEIEIVYPLGVSCLLIVLYLVHKMVRLNAFMRDLETAKTLTDDLYADTYLEKVVYNTIADLHHSYHISISSLQEQLEGRNNLFSQFVHNMKSSVAVIGLACEKQSGDILTDISLENEKLKKNLEQALNILRLDEFANDYVPEQVDLSHLVRSVINDKRRDFIYAKTYPKFSDTGTYVYTDKKWCTFMVEQIVSNAIKYSGSDKCIYFEIQKEDGRVSLRIRDEGIGIMAEDLPRIFDLFYTGINGRQNKESTGIGLSMVKHICKKLGHGVAVESQVGQETTVIITFLTKM